MYDRSIRSLVNLKANASTARVLNLLAAWKSHGDTEAHVEAPFFHSRLLNRSIIVKHRLRRDELDLFRDTRHVATKVILPLDPNDLRIGGRSFFVGQRDYARLLREITMQDEALGLRDDQLLHLLDTLPSLDPFLMREKLRERNFEPAQCYFDLSEADAQRMYGFLRQELMPLIGASFNGDTDVLRQKTGKLATKILNNANDAELEPLRLVLGLSPEEFTEGVFCWKGYVYYKWRLSELLPRVRPVSHSIANIQTWDTTSRDASVYIAASRRTLKLAVAEACQTTHVALKVYDDAFADLTRRGQPRAFREFLLRSPKLFHELGERLGGLEHIVSFWRYRFPLGESTAVSTDELRDIFMDFETSLNAPSRGARAELRAVA